LEYSGRCRRPRTIYLERCWAIGQETQAIWNIATIVGDPIQAIWNVTTIVGDPLQAIWSVLEEVGDPVQLIWNVSSDQVAVVGFRFTSDDWATITMSDESMGRITFSVETMEPA